MKKDTRIGKKIATKLIVIVVIGGVCVVFWDLSYAFPMYECSQNAHVLQGKYEATSCHDSN